MNEITPDLLKRIIPTMPRAKREQYAPLIQASCREFDITTKLRVAAYLSQLAHESDHFNTLSEYASGAAYDNRKDLGNTRPEAITAAKRHNTTPGRFYKGHGAIQTTGYSNHKRVGEYLGIDTVNEPGLLAAPEYAFRAAGFFWRDNNVNRWADRGEIRAVSGVVNAGSPNAKRINGLADRQRYYKLALEALPDDFKLSNDASKLDMPYKFANSGSAIRVTDTDKGVTADTESPDDIEGTLPQPVIEQPKNPPPREINPETATGVPISRPSLWGQIKDISIPTGIGGVLTIIGTIFKSIPPWAWAVIIVAVIAGAVYLIGQRNRRAHERTLKAGDMASSPERNNIWFK
jgi:putative chitinase